ncbi:hypothetical protein Tco_1560941 [Tanacetum coccineum]
MHEVQCSWLRGCLEQQLGMLILVTQADISATLNENRVALDEDQLLFIAGGQDNVIDKDVDEQPVQDLALNVDNVFQADDCDAFDSDVDDAPVTRTMFMANLSSTDLVYDEVGPSYDSDILSEVHDHDHYQDAVCEHHEEHEMHDDVQPNYVVDSYANYTSDSNMISYDQYVKDNAVPVVQSNVSFVPNNAYMLILNDMHEQPAQYVSGTTLNTVVDKSLTAELATYKEQVELYERRARFELTEREQKIDAQLRIVITDRNIKEERLKKELHFVAIGYKNPLCLTRAKQVQPALYNGHEIIKTNHVPTIVHNTEDTLEIAEMTKKKMNEKMKDPESHQDESRSSQKADHNLKTKQSVDDVLTKEIKEMKDIFEELEAEVDQNVINRKHDEIKRKNILIVHDNLIADCLSKDVFYIAINSELTVSRFTEMHDANTIVQACCLELEPELSNLRDKLKYQNLKESFGNNPPPPARVKPDFDSVFITHLTEKVTVLQEQNKLFRTENEKVKQHYKELYDSIKITRAKHIEQITAVLTKNENLKAQIQNKMKCVTKDHVKPTILALGKYAIDVEPIPPRNRNNREVHLDYLKNLKESVETLREIVEEAKELLEYVIGTCPKDFNQRDKKHAPTPLIRKKQVAFEAKYETSNSITHKHVEQLHTQKTNVPVPPSTGVNSCTDASGS